MSFLVSASTFCPKYRILDHLSDSASTIQIILLNRKNGLDVIFPWIHLNTNIIPFHTMSRFQSEMTSWAPILAKMACLSSIREAEQSSTRMDFSWSVFLALLVGGGRPPFFQNKKKTDLWKVHLRISGIIIDYRFFADTPSLHSHCCFAKNLFQCRRRVDHHMLFQITGIRLHQFGHTPGTWKNHEVSINGHDLQKSHTSFCQVGHHVVEFVHLLGCNGTFVAQKLTTWSTYVKATEYTIGPKREKQIQILKNKTLPATNYTATSEYKFRTARDGRLDTLDRHVSDATCWQRLKGTNKQKMPCEGSKLLYNSIYIIKTY